ncbi:LysM peptidoglycan-binding domain-containing protein [Streptomyces sp. APSN-46.1]|uniref:CIS tube protein n=1 Tax=Streptomyces sp. APSN-46.1 TaxID=2929049 RepID=UPI001FB41B25|nr:LysM peptidoglycan-binding domain-containing protein [Streptomyces sp. APSN-46.1]MCJ1676502.1 LysM peptidoglycan-binding domain-containing protein [Streptomyces sp. APSN-46.1]
MPSTPFRLPAVPGPAPVSAALAKAEIIDTASGESFSVMFNPEELKLDQGNSFAEIGIPGLNTPPVQYVRGRARTLSMELFFDTYEAGTDVRAYTGPIVRLLDKQPRTQGPPILLFSLGGFQFRCVLVDAGQRFTMFLRNGTPVRSSLSVRLQEYVPTDIDVRRGVFFASPTVSGIANRATETARSAMAGSPSVHVVVRGDTLSGLAGIYLGDPALWREIADANRIADPLDLVPDTRLVIPPKGRGGGRR